MHDLVPAEGGRYVVEVMEKGLVGCVCDGFGSFYHLEDHSTDGSFQLYLFQRTLTSDVLTLRGTRRGREGNRRGQESGNRGEMEGATDYDNVSMLYPGSLSQHRLTHQYLPGYIVGLNHLRGLVQDQVQ